MKKKRKYQASLTPEQLAQMLDIMTSIAIGQMVKERMRKEAKK